MRKVSLFQDQAPRGGSDYPLVSPVDDALEALSDLQLAYDGQKFKQPLRITFAEGFGDGGSQDADLLVVDAADEVVFDTRQASSRSHQPWASLYTILVWETDSRRLTAIRQESIRAGKPAQIATCDYALNPRTLRTDAQQIKKVEFYRGRSDTPYAEIPAGSRLRLKPGYNLELNYQPPEPPTGSGQRRFFQIDAASQPGFGEGKFKNCDDEGDGVLRTISRVEPDAAGNFQLSADLCFRIEPVTQKNFDGTVSIQRGVLSLADDCEACCDCDDYLRVYQAMLRLRRRFEVVGKNLETILDRYHAVREELMSRTQCTNSLIKINAAQTDDCLLSVAASVCNTTGENADDVSVEFSATRITYDGQLEETGRFGGWSYNAILYRADQPEGVRRVIGYNFDPDDPRGGAENLSVDFGCVPRNDTRSAAFTLRFHDSGRYRICAKIKSGITPPVGDIDNACREIDVKCDHAFWFPEEDGTTTTSSTTTSPPVNPFSAAGGVAAVFSFESTSRTVAQLSGLAYAGKSLVDELSRLAGGEPLAIGLIVFNSQGNRRVVALNAGNQDDFKAALAGGLLSGDADRDVDGAAAIHAISRQDWSHSSGPQGRIAFHFATSAAGFSAPAITSGLLEHLGVRVFPVIMRANYQDPVTGELIYGYDPDIISAADKLADVTGGEVILSHDSILDDMLAKLRAIH